MGNYWGGAEPATTADLLKQLSDPEKIDGALKALWTNEDKNKSDILEIDEAEHFLREVYKYLSNEKKLNFESSEDELIKSWRITMDADKNGKITWDEFKTSAVSLIVNPIIKNEEKKYELVVIFKIELKNLPNMDYDMWLKDNPSDPYVVVTYNQERKETEYLTDCNNPVWNPNFAYVAVEPHGDFQFEVFDYDYNGNDKIGSFTISMKSILEKLSATHESSKKHQITVDGNVTLQSCLPQKLKDAAIENPPTYKIDFQCQEWGADYGFDEGDQKLNWFNYLVWKAVLAGRTCPVRAEDVKPPSVKKAPFVEQCTPIIKVAGGDYTVDATPLAVEYFAKLACSTSPYEDSSRYISRKEGIETIGKIFGAYIPCAPEGEWTEDNYDLTSDHVLTRFFFYGIGATRVRRAEDGTFYADFDAMKDYPVRPGYTNYQGKIFFDNKGKVTHIEYNNQKILPGDGEKWEKAKFIVRSSALTSVTANEHLVQSHFIWSNFTTESATTNLDPTHPLRRLLHIHTYRAGLVNHQALLLLTPPGGLLSRAFSFPYPTLQNVLNDYFTSFKYYTFPELIKNANMEGVDDNLFPLAKDGMDYWNVVHKYVRDYLNVVYTTEEKLKSDQQVVDFWKQLNERIPNGIPELTLINLINYVTQFIHYVTGVHTHSGNVSAYARDPAFTGGSIVENSLMIPPQNSFTQAIIIAVTAGEMPSMNQDFSHFMLSKETRDVWLDFHNSLLKLGSEIDERNKTRRWKYNNMNPNFMETSVSV